MSRIVHMCLDVRGAMMWPKSRLKGMFRHVVTGKPCTYAESMESLMDHVAQGHIVIPIGNECDGFSYETGCPGHERDEEDYPK